MGAVKKVRNIFHCQDRATYILKTFNKKRATNPILRSVKLCRGSKILCMPAENGDEVKYADECGCIREDIFTIERDPHIHTKHIGEGFTTTPKAMEISPSLRHIARSKLNVFDLIYLDFQTMLGKRYLTDLKFIFEKGLLNVPSTLMVTTGWVRPSKDALALENKAIKAGWTETRPATPFHIMELLSEMGITYKNITWPIYQSERSPFVITVVNF